MRFFFYGTLIDPDVRRVVLGARAAAAIHLRDAVLPNWERRAMRGVSYPVILARAGGRVAGMLASGLDARGRRRLVAYEGEGYDLVRVDVVLGDATTKPALVFAPSLGGPLKPDTASWCYARWARESKRAFMREIGEGRAAARP